MEQNKSNHQHVSSKIENSCKKATCSHLKPIDKIPVEIWETIFSNLQHSQDLVNVSFTCTSWSTILAPSKTTWLFDSTILHLFPYLTKSDILSCRRICKSWKFAVDDFLENNPYQRPAFGKNLEYRTDRLHTLTKQLKERNLLVMYLIFHDSRFPLESTPYHNPLVGKSVLISMRSERTLNVEFVQKFGQHVHFLFAMSTGSEQIQETIIPTLNLMPNLKRLNVSFCRPFYNSPSNLVTFTPNQLENLPKLETLEISASKLHESHSHLLNLIPKDNLSSLSLHDVHLPQNIQLEKLTSLTITLGGDQQLKRIMALNSPLFKLNILISEQNQTSYQIISEELLFQALNHFSKTLQNFGLLLESSAFIFSENFVSVLKMDGILNLPLVKTLTISIFLPSLNIFCGLGNSVEFLNVYVDNNWNIFQVFGKGGEIEETKEILDLERYIYVNCWQAGQD